MARPNLSHALRFAAPFAASLACAAVAHAYEVKRLAPETCSNAHALLVASRHASSDLVWNEIRGVIREGHGKWVVVDDYEPMVAQKVSLRQYSVRGGSAYVVHCGHGGTCNSLTKAFFEKRSDWYSPEVFCGEVPRWLSDGRAP